MNVKIELDARTERFVRRLLARNLRRDIARALQPVYQRLAQIGAGRVTSSLLSGKGGLARRTGALARSVTGRVINGQGGLPGISVGVFRGPQLRYAGVLEYGTVGAGGRLPTIKPRTAGALAVPVGAALTAAGVPRYAGPREYPEPLRFGRARSSAKSNVVGYLFPVRQAGFVRGVAVAQSGPPVYVLLSSSDIAPRRWLSTPMRAFIPMIVQETQDALRALAEGRAPGESRT